MSRFKAGTGVLIVALALVLGVGGPAFAQGSIFSRLSGTVVDTEGAAMPGVNVTVKNLGTGQVISLVTGSDGTFTAPNITSGKYSVTAELQGFKSTELDSVSVATGIPTAVKITMQIGTLAETITVVGESSNIVQTQSPAIATKIGRAHV